MRKKTVDITPVLSDVMKNILASFSKSRSLPGGLIKRSKIVLLAAQGLSNRAIATQVELHYNHVATWRNRFLKALPLLLDIEAECPEKLEDEIKLILTDLKRSGAPAEFSQEQIIKIINLACKAPEDFDHEVSHWTLTLLVSEIKKQGIAEQISPKSVSRFLKMRQI